LYNKFIEEHIEILDDADKGSRENQLAT